MTRGPLRGCVAAAVTPLKDDGAAVDLDAIEPYVAYLEKGGVDGIFPLGTTGEGLLLSTEERERAAEAFVAAAHKPGRRRLSVAVHCGAATTAEAARLSAHAASIGADATVALGPTFFSYDAAAQLAHFRAVAAASRGSPFYVYEFAARVGYRLAPELLAKLRDLAPNFVGAKVSNATFDAVEPYLDPTLGLDVFVGAEALIARALAAGATGAVSGLAAVFPEVVSAHVRAPDAAGSTRVAELRRRVEAAPFHAASKEILVARGVPMRASVRAPLRPLDAAEARAARALAAADV
jgi:dihydrodipicolinate synthase/N-acetylneuraminate lyase